jgi:2'-5' RNA ligase
MSQEGILPKPHITVWLVPPKTSPLSSLHRWMQEEHPTSPTFAMHITLLSALPPGDDTIRRVGKVARETGRIAVELTGVSTHDDFFTSVVAEAEGEGIVRVAKILREEFKGEVPDSAFHPHLSLLYGLKDGEERQRAKESVGQWPGWMGEEWEGEASFVGETLVVIDCGGRVDEWRVVAEVPLGTPQEMG